MYLQLLFFVIYAAVSFVTCLNVGTVLFTERDRSRECWDVEGLALVTSRMILTDVLPERLNLANVDANFASDIIEYFRLSLDVVRRMTYGKSRHVMLLALADILGGYMRHVVLPLAKYAYYIGRIDYESVNKLYELFEELKCFLRTNGQGWAAPITLPKARAKALPKQSPTPHSNPCKGLIFTQTPGEGIGQPCGIVIPMPYFDSRSRPTAIAVPFKMYPLRNVESKVSANILVKFYIASCKCMALQNANRRSVEEFNNRLLIFLRYQVLQRFADEKFYVAFGAVMKIYASLLRDGATTDSASHDIVSKQIDSEPNETTETNDESNFSMAAERKSSTLILFAILVAVSIWFLLGSLFICWRIRTNRKARECDCQESGGGNSRKGHVKKIASNTSSASQRSKKQIGLAKTPDSRYMIRRSLKTSNLDDSSNKQTPSTEVEVQASYAASSSPEESTNPRDNMSNTSSDDPHDQKSKRLADLSRHLFGHAFETTSTDGASTEASPR